ncbi:MAG: TrkH family potassium uptake protein [Paramuribaculum sp.]|nr:TrkH family potassium uptake protein [Paramuribaculum sp.]
MNRIHQHSPHPSRHSQRHFSGLNIRMLVKVIGWLLLIEAAFMFIPLAACFIWEQGRDSVAFMWAIAITALCGCGATFLSRPMRTDMRKRESYILTALVWVVFSAFAMIPFMLCSTPFSLCDAYFEAMSGFTTTGATALGSINSLSHGILMWRCLMQWLGGMGIILFTLAILPALNHSGGMMMFNAEVTGITHDKIRPRISQTAKGLWGIYFLLSVLLFVLLLCGPMNAFESICHAMSTISTGGNSTTDSSISHWNSVYVESILTLFMFLGGVNFVLIYKLGVTRKIRSLWDNEVFRTYVYIIAVLLVVYAASIIAGGNYTDVKSVTIDPLFQIVSTITSTGYVINGFEKWGPFILAVTFMLMFFGGCAGSTSGGAKIDRLIYLAKNTGNEISKVLHPHAILSVRVNNKVVPHDLVAKVIAFLCLYMMTIAAGSLLLSALGIPVADAFFSSFSCVCNTGFGTSITGYGGSYDIMPDAAKWILSFLMLTGRLELFTVFVLFTRRFWHN